MLSKNQAEHVYTYVYVNVYMYVYVCIYMYLYSTYLYKYVSYPNVYLKIFAHFFHIT